MTGLSLRTVSYTYVVIKNLISIEHSSLLSNCWAAINTWVDMRLTQYTNVNYHLRQNSSDGDYVCCGYSAVEYWNDQLDINRGNSMLGIVFTSADVLPLRFMAN